MVKTLSKRNWKIKHFGKTCELDTNIEHHAGTESCVCLQVAGLSLKPRPSQGLPLHLAPPGARWVPVCYFILISVFAGEPGVTITLPRDSPQPLPPRQHFCPLLPFSYFLPRYELVKYLRLNRGNLQPDCPKRRREDTEP